MAETVRVFVSYSREDESVATRLRTDLGRTGAVIWIDHEQLKPDTPDWEDAVRKGIAQATAVVYIASHDARQSVYVRDEIAIARQIQKPVYPFWAAGKHWHDCVPLGWGATQYADGRGAHYEQGLHELLAVLGHCWRRHAGHSACPAWPHTRAKWRTIVRRADTPAAAHARVSRLGGEWDRMHPAAGVPRPGQSLHDGQRPQVG
jgi:hypothetical protein